MRIGEIKRLEEILAYAVPENRWIKLYFDRVKFPGGTEGRYNRIVECDGRIGVAILPLHDTYVGLVRQFRYPIGGFHWEIPRGFGGENGAAAQALTELREETGIEARTEELIDLGTIYPNSGLLSSEVHLFAVVTESFDAHPTSPDSESAEFRWFPVIEVLALVDSADIKDAFTMCALLRALGRQLIKIR